ncbi:hypothetical protein ACHAXN_008261 [Cyclotella atomus]
MIDPSPLLSAQDRSDKDVCMFFFVATAVNDCNEEKVNDEDDINDTMLAAAVGEPGWLLGSQMMENDVQEVNA